MVKRLGDRWHAPLWLGGTLLALLPFVVATCFDGSRAPWVEGPGNLGTNLIKAVWWGLGGAFVGGVLGLKLSGLYDGGKFPALVVGETSLSLGLVPHFGRSFWSSQLLHPGRVSVHDPREDEHSFWADSDRGDCGWRLLAGLRPRRGSGPAEDAPMALGSGSGSTIPLFDRHDRNPVLEKLDN